MNQNYGKFLNQNKLSTKVVGFLSGAPRVSTHEDAEATGPRSHVLGVTQALINLGWEVKTFIVGDRVPKKMYDSDSRKRLSSNYLTRLFADLVRILLSSINSHLAYKEIGKVDFVYERFGTFQKLGKKFKRNGIPWVLETNGPFFIEAGEQRQSLVLTSLARKIELQAYRDCDVLVCVTNELKEIIIREAEISPDKVFVLPNGVDVHLFDPRGVNGSNKYSYPLIGYVGALIARQGLDLLLTAIAELKTEGINYSLVIIGDGPEKNRLQELSHKLGLHDRVFFLGLVPRKDIPKLIAGFDIGYSGQIVIGEGLMSKMYHSPLKIYEYLAMGKPVIASEYEDAKRLISSPKLGYLIEPGSKDSLLTKLREAYVAQDEWKVMGELARKVIIKDHSWEARIEKLIVFLQDSSIIGCIVDDNLEITQDK